jgi:hypothetical protein
VISLDGSDPVLGRFIRDLDRESRLDLGALLPDLSRVSPEDVEVAQTAWAHRVMGEFRGVPIYAELFTLLTQAEAPYGALAAVQRIIGDELRHTRICATVVDWLGGWDSLEVDLSGQRMPRWDGPPAARALEIVARELIVVEAAAVRNFRAHLRAVEDPALRAVFESLLADEVRHAAAGVALRDLIERHYPERDLREAQARLAAVLPGDENHLLELEMARAGDHPGRALGATLRPEDLEGL